MDKERKRRLGLNEAIFRDVNERLQEISTRFHLEQLDLLCECSDTACSERVAMSTQEYQELRSDPTHFAVVAGHEVTDVERIVDERKGYNVVEKHAGVPAQVAEETDPRS